MSTEDFDRLPRLSGPIALADATLLEASSPEHLARLARDPRIGRHLLARLDDRTALVCPDAVRALVTALREGGHGVRLTQAGS